MRYVNHGEATFRGVEVGRYYVTRNVSVLGSFLHQSNEDEDGNTNFTPVPNTSAKGGVSFQNERGITASIFDNYQGSIDEFSSVVNPPRRAICSARMPDSNCLAPECTGDRRYRARRQR